jgi:hypothetical protein
LSMTTKRRTACMSAITTPASPENTCMQHICMPASTTEGEATEKIVRLSFSRTRSSAKFLAAQLHPSHCVAQGLTNMRASIRTNILNSQGSDPKTWIICLHLADYVIVAHTTTEMPPTSGRGKRRQRKG